MIYKITKCRLAWETVIPELNRAWTKVTNFKDNLENTSLTITTTMVISQRDYYNTKKTQLTNFNTNYGTWFDSTFPDWASQMDGVILSLGNIIDHINTMIETNYWDTETGKPIITDVSQAHRNQLAIHIGDESA